jgi:hypothetical protein
MQEASTPVNTNPRHGNEPLHGSSRQAWTLGNLKPRAQSCDTAVILSLPEPWWRAERRMLPYQFRIWFEASVPTQNYDQRGQGRHLCTLNSEHYRAEPSSPAELNGLPKKRIIKDSACTC